jgi:predicted phage tail protein
MSAIETVRVQIPVIRVTNPFNPREFVREELTWSPAKTLLDYFPTPSVQAVVSINGKIVKPEDYATTYLDSTDNLVVCPVPTGGGDGGKTVLRIVAMIAVSYFTVGMGASAAAGMGLTGGAATFAGAAMQVGITMAGSMLVNSLLAPPAATKDDTETSSSYGIDGAKNTSIEGIAVPVCYGEFRMGGNVLSLYVDNVSDDNQVLYMLIAAGEGSVSSLSDVYVNDTPVSNFNDVEVQTRLGLPNQLPIPWFTDTVTAHSKGHKLTEDWYYATTTVAVDKFRLDFMAPALAKINSKTGKAEAWSVDLDLEYRPVGGTTWLDMPTESVTDSWQTVTASYVAPVGTYNASYDAATKVATYYSSQSGFDNPVYVSNPALTWFYANGSVITDPEHLMYLATAPVTYQQETNYGN